MKWTWNNSNDISESNGENNFIIITAQPVKLYGLKNFKGNVKSWWIAEYIRVNNSARDRRMVYTDSFEVSVNISIWNINLKTFTLDEV